MGEFVLKIKKDSLKSIIGFIPILFFIVAALFYINFDKLPLDHPGNIKAADGFAHILAVEKVLDTKQWNYDDTVLSLGKEKMSSVQPPLFYIDAAVLTLFSGLPAWVTFYFLVCLSQALFVLLVYLITEEIFENKKISLIAAGISILPLPVNIWLYATYIGIWIQVCGYSIILAFFWLFIKYLKTKENWILPFMGICISSLVLTHTADIIILLLPSLWVGLIFIMEFIKKKDMKILIKKMLLFGIIPLIIILLLLPKFLFVWRGYAGSDAYGFKIDFKSDFSKTGTAASLVFPSFSNLPIYWVVFSLIGMLILVMNQFYPYSFSLKNEKKIAIVGKKSKKFSVSWLFLLAYMFFMIYLSETFLNKPYYILRMRALQPYLLFPLIAFGIYLVMQIGKMLVVALSAHGSNNKDKAFMYFEKKNELIDYVIVAVVIFMAINSAMPAYRQQVDSMQYEHVSLTQWEAYKWIHKNTKISDKILFFGSHDQSEGLYIKRAYGIFAHQDFQNYLRSINNTVPSNFTISGWGGSTPRSRIIEISPWRYEQIEDPDTKVSLFDFDYIFFMDKVPGMKDVNDFFTMGFSKVGFLLVYNKDGYRILKNERSN